MVGETDLNTLLSCMNPKLDDTEYVFISLAEKVAPQALMNKAVATVLEAEGLTLVLPREVADTESLSYESVLCRITLTIHSSLEAVGLTASIATALANQNISANVIAGYFHDHLFVPRQDAPKAMTALKELSNDGN